MKKKESLFVILALVGGLIIGCIGHGLFFKGQTSNLICDNNEEVNEKEHEVRVIEQLTENNNVQENDKVEETNNSNNTSNTEIKTEKKLVLSVYTGDDKNNVVRNKDVIDIPVSNTDAKAITKATYIQDGTDTRYIIYYDGGLRIYNTKENKSENINLGFTIDINDFSAIVRGKYLIFEQMNGQTKVANGVYDMVAKKIKLKDKYERLLVYGDNYGAEFANEIIAYNNIDTNNQSDAYIVNLDTEKEILTRKVGFWCNLLNYYPDNTYNPTLYVTRIKNYCGDNGPGFDTIIYDTKGNVVDELKSGEKLFTEWYDDMATVGKISDSSVTYYNR